MCENRTRHRQTRLSVPSAISTGAGTGAAEGDLRFAAIKINYRMACEAPGAVQGTAQIHPDITRAATVAKSHCLLCGEQVQDVQSWRRLIKQRHTAMHPAALQLAASNTLLQAQAVRPLHVVSGCFPQVCSRKPTEVPPSFAALLAP